MTLNKRQGYNHHMLKHLPGAALALFCLSWTACAFAAPDSPTTNHVSALYSTWDDYYFYVGVQVHDPHVVSTNDSPTAQPQQDDDIEVFLETDDARASRRTPHTYQMAVSAANGAYFSVGDDTKTPKAKAVYTYKYAATVDGTLNDNSDTDTGYTIELAIPWQELGRSGPPKSGETWGFNVISRDRETTAHPATRFYSLSPDVQSAADVQDPSKWSRLVFDAGTETSGASTPDRVVSPHVNFDRFPVINGSIVSGEWPSVARIAFGRTAVEAPAPTVAEEPNVSDSTFGALPPAEPPAPTPPATPTPARPARTAQTPSATQIPLPFGGSIKIVPGGSSIHIAPPDMTPPPVEATVPQVSGLPGARVNPLTPKPGKHFKSSPSPVSLVGSLKLGPVTPPSLVMAIYRVDYNADGRKAPSQNVWNAQGGSLLVDQPINGSGPWFSGLRPLWHRQQLSDLRRAGIDVALIRAQSSDPLLGRELDALVEALKEMKAQRLDYPLLGVDTSGGTAALNTVYAHIPTEFRATVPHTGDNGSGVTVYSSGEYSGQAALADGTPISLISDAAVVSPGRVDIHSAIGRQAGQTYAEAWRKATDSKSQFVVVDSWNDFSHGTEICASRQYGERYADDTRLFSNTFNGSHEWHAKYLAEYAPRTIQPKTLYTIPIRIENAGTLPWRARENYALAPRWYKDGRLFDDSAARVPVGSDVLPGRAVTLNVPLVAVNGYGDDLEPGAYTLVFDVVQGDDRWFSYAGDSPLQVPVTVTAAGAPVAPRATFIGTGTPAAGQAGATYNATVTVRNDGADAWSKERLAYKIQTVAESGDVQTVADAPGLTAGPLPIAPGQIAETAIPVALSDAQGHALPVGEYRLHWYIRPAGSGEPITGSYDEALRVVSSDPGANFILSDIPRQVDAGKDAIALLAVQNVGPHTWGKSAMTVGYHWYFLDGREALWDGDANGALGKDIIPDAVAGNVSVKFHAPDQPGRYALVFDVRASDGAWASTAPVSKGNDLLPVFVTVGGKGTLTTLDLSKYATIKGISGPDKNGDLDGAGFALPAETLPPDGTAEIDANPILLGKPGPPLYPSGFYAVQTGDGFTGNHGVSFLYPIPREGAPNVVACQGQTIALPGGAYKAIHLLAAATGGQTVSAAFALSGSSQTLAIADWTQTPSGPSATPAFRSPYRIGPNGVDATPVTLGDYTLTATDRVTGLTLPNNPAIKILAITLEK